MDARAWELFDPALAPTGEDLRPFLKEALARATRWFVADSASAFLVARPGEYALAAQCGGIPLDEGTLLRAGVAQAAIDAREPLLVGNPADHPRLKCGTGPRRTDVASAMVLPLLLPDGEAVGVLNLARCPGVTPYAEGDLEQARHIAGHIAMAVGLALRTVAAARLARIEARGRHLAEIGQMAAILAHEIRNPLSAIRLAAQLASEFPEYAGVIVEESDRLEEICEGFLDLARPLEVKRRSTQLPELLRGLADREESAFQEADVRFTVREQDSTAIDVDPLRIEQACRNLLKNAREATGPGGKVTLTIWKDGFEVQDDGPGVSPEVREALFTPFVTAKPRGTGLGLTVVQRVAEAHGGRVVLSKEGPGASFRFELGVAA